MQDYSLDPPWMSFRFDRLTNQRVRGSDPLIRRAERRAHREAAVAASTSPTGREEPDDPRSGAK